MAMKRIAVYGSLRKGEYNHRIIKERATHVQDGVVRGAKLIGGNAYPWIIPGEAGDFVLVEVYDLDDETFGWIENMELGAGYERKPVKVEHNDGDGTAQLDAEAYFFTNPKWLEEGGYPHLEHGDWTKRDGK